MSSLPRPPPVSPGSVGVRRRMADTPGLCSQGLLSITASCWPRGQPCVATAEFSSVSFMLGAPRRTRSRGNQGEIILSNVQFTRVVRQRGKQDGERPNPTCCSSFPCTLLACSRAGPSLSAHSARRGRSPRAVLLCVHAAARRATLRAACASACVVRQLAAEKLIHPETSAHTAR